jgi:type IV secretory pathway VirB3-like protein
MKWGVPFEGFVVNSVISLFVAVLIIGSPVGFVLGLIVHMIMRELCRVDPHFFHKWRMFSETKMRSMTGAVWGGSRLQPAPSRVRRPGDFPSYV